MHSNNRLFRLSAAAAVTAIGIGSVAPAYAQAPGAGQLAGDPPARVGRIARIAGTVSFHTADQEQWEPATVNYPVTSGNAFWTQPSSSADLGIGSVRVTLDQSTAFTVDTLDDQSLLATAAQGRVFLHVRDLAQGETETLRTPRGTVSISQPGRYEIVVGDTQTPTLVTVDEGAAVVTGPNVSLNVAPHETGQISGNDAFIGVLVAENPDPFLSAQIARDQPVREIQGGALPPAVQQMTGYEAVATTGDWQEAPQYGRVWYPPVARDWVPYRHGHWGWVAPWGWTWVDDAPWGFAPFHYGRWVEIENRWAWTPVEQGVVYERPCYSPALVTFLGVGAGVAIGVGIAAAVGWIPLGPREAYRPPYQVSNNYFRRVNINNVTNVTNITNVTNNNTTVVNQRFINRGAATVVPATAMQRSQPVAAVAQAQVRQATLQPLLRAPVQPTLATSGVTPAVAHALNIQPPAGKPLPRPPAAPGPAFRPRPVAAVQPGVIAPPGAPVVPGRGPLPGPGPGPGPGTARPGPAPGPAPGLPVATQPGNGRPVPGLPVPGQPGPGRPAPGLPAQGQGVAGQPTLATRPPGGRPAAPGPAIPPRGVNPLAPARVLPGPAASAAAAPGSLAPNVVRPGQGAALPGLTPTRPNAVPAPGSVAPAVPAPIATARPTAPIAPVVPVVPRAPAPAPIPQVQRPAAALPQAHPPQQQARPAPAPPQPRVAPPPQPRAAPPPQPRPAPPPQPRPAPPPQPRPAPPPQPRPAPPPQPRPAPPRPAPAPKQCPPGRPNC